MGDEFVTRAIEVAVERFGRERLTGHSRSLTQQEIMDVWHSRRYHDDSQWHAGDPPVTSCSWSFDGQPVMIAIGRMPTDGVAVLLRW